MAHPPSWYRTESPTMPLFGAWPIGPSFIWNTTTSRERRRRGQRPVAPPHHLYWWSCLPYWLSVCLSLLRLSDVPS